MYFFTGSNLFGQWIGYENNVADRFMILSSKQFHCEDFDVNAACLVYLGWSHNIFYYNNKFYIVGDYRNSGQNIETVILPEECKNSSNSIIVSNDYHLVVVNRNTCTFWTINLENKISKALNLNTEKPLSIGQKRSKIEDSVLKCVSLNNSIMFLTSNRLVYCGLIPSLIDTSHCIGEPMDIQCGYEHYMILTTTGKLYTWGNGRRMQLGHGNLNILDTPTEVEALSGIKILKIAAGGWHSLALSEFGDLYAWGWNDTGQLGIKENCELNKSYALPCLVDFVDDMGMTVHNNVKDMACGSRHSAILLDDNSVWTTGHNKYGQLGHSIQEFPTVYNFKKNCSFKFVHKLMCGQWSTVINATKLISKCTVEQSIWRCKKVSKSRTETIKSFLQEDENNTYKMHVMSLEMQNK